MFWKHVVCSCVLLLPAVTLAQEIEIHGAPLTHKLLKINYGRVPKEMVAFDITICNKGDQQRTVTSPQIYQALRAELEKQKVRPIGRQIALAAVVRAEKLHPIRVAGLVLESFAGLGTLLTSSDVISSGRAAKTATALASILVGQFTATVKGEIPADRVQRFDREALEPAVLLEKGACVERTLFAVTLPGQTHAAQSLFSTFPVK